MPDTNHGIPYPGPVPLPTPEHQKKITREKWFEIVTVISVILAGTAFLAWRNYASQSVLNPARSLDDAKAAVIAAGYAEGSTTTLLQREFHTFDKGIEGFDCHADLLGASATAPLDAIIVWLTPERGTAPTPEALQVAVNSVGALGQAVVPTMGEALVKASKTMTFESDAIRPHDKGVAVTNDGWKLSYITYRSYEETGDPPPMLFLVLHRLSAASNDALAELNRGIYEAINQGKDVKTALRALGNAGSPG